jgi:hypothetical protein
MVRTGEDSSSCISFETNEEAALHQILASAAFQRAPALSRLLTYLWEHRCEPPSEYSIGIDVFGKRADFDPKLDATVRVHISRLRQKLKDYCETAAGNQPVTLILPPGQHRLHVQRAKPFTAVVDSPASPPSNGSRTTMLLVAAAVAIALLLCAALWQWRERRAVEASVKNNAAANELPPFWRRVLANGKLTRIVFPTPVFVQFGSIRVRDVKINDIDKIQQSVALRPLEPMLQDAKLSQTYSVTSDTLALGTLMGILANRGLPLTISPTRDLSLEEFGSDNLLFLGVPPTSQHIERLLSRTHFYLQPGGDQIGIRDPTPDEKRLSLRESSDSIHFGIVTVLPGEARGTNMVLLCGLHSAALASYLASPLTLRELEKFLQARGMPQYFEMIVRTEQEGLSLLKARPVAFRPIPVTHSN